MSAMVLDSSGWIEIFTAGANAERFAVAIEAAGRVIVPSVIVFEVYRYSLRHFGESTAKAHWATLDACDVISLTTEIAASAATLAHKHRLAMADAVIYATSVEHQAVLWTQDADLRDLPGVNYFAKPKPA